MRPSQGRKLLDALAKKHQMRGQAANPTSTSEPTATATTESIKTDVIDQRNSDSTKLREPTKPVSEPVATATTESIKTNVIDQHNSDSTKLREPTKPVSEPVATATTASLKNQQLKTAPKCTDIMSDYSPSESALLSPEFAMTVSETTPETGLPSSDKLKSTEDWVDMQSSFTQLEPVPNTFMGNIPNEFTPDNELTVNNNPQSPNCKKRLYTTLTTLPMDPQPPQAQAVPVFTSDEVSATSFPPSPGCKKRLFTDSVSDVGLGTAPLETQTYAVLTSIMTPPVEPTAMHLDFNENLIMPFNEDLQMEEVTIASDHSIISAGETPQVEAVSTVQAEDQQLDPADETVKKKRTRQATPSPNSPTKKRQSHPSLTIAARTKTAYNSGLPHTTKRGKEREGRSVKPGCTGKCRQSCQARITPGQRQKVFDSYYSSANKASQWLMVSKMVRSKPIQRRTIIADSPHRKMSYEYYLPDDSDNLIKVCQTMFLHTLDISVTVVQSAMKKNSPDKRGKHVKKRVRTHADIIQSVKDHIKSFPTIESHYCREGSKRQYLQENLNVSKMYRMYILGRGKNTPNTASLRQYQDIFNNSFNLAFYKPKKDQCALCARWKSLTPEERESKIDLASEYSEHMQAKTLVREIRKDMKILSRSETNKQTMKVICFDLQKVFFCPKSEVGEFFYKGKISCYDFTIFDCSLKKAFCYVWDMTVGGRGSAEMLSCVYKYIKQEAAAGVKEFQIFSDSCFGQNKNQFLYTMYSVVSQKLGIKIVHRYLQKGHTQMECDSVHARIERKIRNTEIFLPSEWYGYIQSAKVKRPMYTVIKVTQDDILSFHSLAEDHFNWVKVPISKVHEIVVDGATPGKVSYKKKISDEATECEVLKKKPGRPFNWLTYKPARMYEKPLALKASLIKDLKWMLNENLIPDRAIQFYETVTSPDFGVFIEPEGPTDNREFPEEVVRNTLDINEDEEHVDNPSATNAQDNNGNSDIDSDVYD